MSANGLSKVATGILPDELNFEILDYVLGSGRSSIGIIFKLNIDVHLDNEDPKFKTDLSLMFLPDSYGLSEIARLKIYGANTIVVDLGANSVKEGLELPSKVTRSYIKDLDVHTDISIQCWDLLAALANGDLGFTSLVKLRVKIQLYGQWRSQSDEEIKAIIRHIKEKVLEFKVLKKFTVEFRYDPYFVRRGGVLKPGLTAEVERAVLQSTTIAPYQGKDVRILNQTISTLMGFERVLEY